MVVITVVGIRIIVLLLDREVLMNNTNNINNYNCGSSARSSSTNLVFDLNNQ